MGTGRSALVEEPLAPHPVLGEFYSEQAGRQAVVNGLFDDCARHYDRINAVMSLGSGGRHRADVLRRIGVREGSRVLDVACGTGVLAAAAMRLTGPSGRVVGVDPSEGMRRVAEARRGVRALDGTAERLPVEDASFDFVVMGYALRHASDLMTAFAEMRRVLRPGGTVAILEVTAPEGRIARGVLRAYLKHFVPVASLAATGSVRALRLMKYYWESIEKCVSPGVIVEAMGRAGLEGAVRRRTLGVFSEYVATAPRTTHE